MYNNNIICTYVSLQKTNIFLDQVFCAYVHYIYAVCVQESYYIPNDDDDDWKRTTYNIHTLLFLLPLPFQLLCFFMPNHFLSSKFNDCFPLSL